MTQASSNNAPWPTYRPPHRRRADEQVHLGNGDLPAVLEHPLVPAGEPAWVETQEALGALVDELRASGSFAYDAEFIGEQTFYPRFCVIQVATPASVFLIDALAGLELLPFWSLLSEPGVEVVVHAGKQDLEPVHRHCGSRAGCVFDTQVAAGFAGLVYPMSLGKLVPELTGAQMGADHKFSAWDRRPLSPTQRAYAANDVRYLLLLESVLLERMRERGHEQRFREEMQTLTDPASFRVNPLEIKLKAKGANDLNRRQQAVVNALLLWRHEQAQKHDVPVRAFLEDAMLVELGKRPVGLLEEVRRLKGLPWPIKELYAREIVSLTQQALAGDLPPRRKRYHPMSEQAEMRLAALWDRALDYCQEQGVAPSLVLNKKELTSLVRASETGHRPEHNRLLDGWRRDFLESVFQGLPGFADVKSTSD
jgi:ribonuclease D